VSDMYFDRTLDDGCCKDERIVHPKHLDDDDYIVKAYEFKMGDAVCIKEQALAEDLKGESEYQDQRCEIGWIVNEMPSCGTYVEVEFPNGAKLLLTPEEICLSEDHLFDDNFHGEVRAPGGFEQDENRRKVIAALREHTDDTIMGKGSAKIGGFSREDREAVHDDAWLLFHDRSASNILRSEFPHGHPRFSELVVEIAKLHSDKNHDYARGGDPLGNFKRCAEALGMPPARYAWMLVWKQIDAVNHAMLCGDANIVESVRDKLRDIAVYSLLIMIMLEEENA